MKNKFITCFNALLKLIINEYTILVFVAVLALFAINIITSTVMIFIIILFFGAIFYAVKITNKKKTYFICLLISCVILVLFSASFIYKIPALSYNFGSPKFVSDANELNHCLDKGIKAVSFVPKNAEMTQYVIREDISLTGNRNIGPNDGYIKFYYSVAQLENGNILLKHSENNMPHNKVITGYLSKLDSMDEQVYENFVHKNLFRAIIVLDSNALDSNMLSWRIWTILQFVISLMSVVLCIYIACKYYRNKDYLY